VGVESRKVETEIVDYLDSESSFANATVTKYGYPPIVHSGVVDEKSRRMRNREQE